MNDGSTSANSHVVAGARALVVFPGALGDLLLLAPALAALRARGFRVELSVQRSLADMARALVSSSGAPPADGAAMASIFTAALHPELVAWMRGAARVDLWLGDDELPHRHRDVLSGARVRCHHVERGDAGPHASVAYACALGVPSADLAPPVAARAWLADAVPPARPRALIIHPGAGAAVKRWTPSGFRRVADDWRACGGETVVLLGPAEEGDADRWGRSGHEVAVGLGLRDVAALIASAPWYVGNDSGMSHLAGLLGRRGVVLFGPTRVTRWRPLGGALEPIVWTDLVEREVAVRVCEHLTALATGGSVGSSS